MGRVRNALEELEAPFFLDLMDEIEAEKRDKRRRDRLRKRGFRLARRIAIVDSYDLWKATAHIRPNFFGNDDRFEQVKVLYRKKERLQWILHAMYWRFVYDSPYRGCDYKLPTKFSRFAKLYEKYKAQHEEAVRQARWDEKRARVRARRTKRESKSDARKRVLLEQVSKLRSSILPPEPLAVPGLGRGGDGDISATLTFTGWD